MSEASAPREATREPVSENTPKPLRVSPRHFSKLEKGLRSSLDPSPDVDPPFLFWISGAHGVGKTTLVEAAATMLGAGGTEFLHGVGHPNTGEILEPVLQAGRALIDRARERAALGAPGWSDAWDEMTTRHAPALHRILPEMDWGAEVEPFPDLDPEFERARLLDHLGGLFLRVAEEIPMVIAIEGGEFLDNLSKELLVNLARVVRSRRQGQQAGLPLPDPPRLSLIITTTTEERAPLNLLDDELLSIHMSGLGRDEFARFLEDEYEEEIPLSTREKLYQLCGGNPLDVQYRIDRERRDEEGGSPHDRAKRLLDYPGYEDSRIAELRRASETEGGVLRALAILEKPVSKRILAAVADQTESAVSAALGSLAELGWVRVFDNGSVGISHDRLAAPVFGTIPEHDRRQLHRKAAEVIAAEYENRPCRRFQEVRFHYSQSTQDSDAIRASFDAAQEARRLFDFHVAIDIYRDLLDIAEEQSIAQIIEAVSGIAELLVDLPVADERVLTLLERCVTERAGDLPSSELSSLWRRLGSLAAKWDLHDKEASYFTAGLDTLGDSPPCHERLMLYATIARACMRHRQYDETLHYCREGIELVQMEQLADDPEYLEIYRVTEEVHFHRGEYVEALEFEEQFLQLANKSRSPMRVLESLLRLSHLHDRRGDQEKARRCLMEAQPVARDTGSRLLEARIDERLGYLHARREGWTEATHAFRQALQVHTEIGEEHRTVRLFGALGMVSLFTGDAEAGARSFRLYALYQGLRAGHELPPQVPGFPCDYRNRSERDDEIRIREETVERAKRLPARTLVDALSELADLRRDRGEFQLARATLRRGHRLAKGENLEPSRFQLQLGILHRMQGEVEPALTCFQKGLESMSSFPDWERIAEINLQVGLLYLSRGDTQRCLNKLVRALRSYLEQEHETGVAHTLVQLGGIYHRLGRRDAAEELGLAALAIADSLRVDRLEAEAWLLLARVRSEDEGGQVPGHQEATLARELFSRLGILEGRCRALLVEGDIFRRWGDMGRAQSLICEALEIARDLGLRPLIAAGLALRGSVEGDRKTQGSDFLRALKTLESALEHAHSIGDRTLDLEVHRHLARLYTDRDRAGVAEKHWEQFGATLETLLEHCPTAFRDSLRRRHSDAPTESEEDAVPDDVVEEATSEVA